jgi:hypothetical protein
MLQLDLKSLTYSTSSFHTLCSNVLGLHFVFPGLFSIFFVGWQNDWLWKLHGLLHSLWRVITEYMGTNVSAEPSASLLYPEDVEHRALRKCIAIYKTTRRYIQKTMILTLIVARTTNLRLTPCHRLQVSSGLFPHRAQWIPVHSLKG